MANDFYAASSPTLHRMWWFLFWCFMFILFQFFVVWIWINEVNVLNERKCTLITFVHTHEYIREKLGKTTCRVIFFGFHFIMISWHHFKESWENSLEFITNEIFFRKLKQFFSLTFQHSWKIANISLAEDPLWFRCIVCQDERERKIPKKPLVNNVFLLIKFVFVQTRGNLSTQTHSYYLSLVSFTLLREI